MCGGVCVRLFVHISVCTEVTGFLIIAALEPLFTETMIN